MNNALMIDMTNQKVKNKHVCWTFISNLSRAVTDKLLIKSLQQYPPINPTTVDSTSNLSRLNFQWFLITLTRVKRNSVVANETEKFDPCKLRHDPFQTSRFKESPGRNYKITSSTSKQKETNKEQQSFLVYWKNLCLDSNRNEEKYKSKEGKYKKTAKTQFHVWMVIYSLPL